jgi:Rrf2 family transcriptional regulator, nitric oxide-sensitive transcriptional repressor
MISQSAEYALRAVACLADRGGVPLTTREIALAAKVPAGYLAKVLQALVRAGIVTSQRGLNGGFVLAQRPEDLTLLDVVRVSDGSRRISTCPLGIASHGPRLCPLHRRLDGAAALAEAALGEVSVAEIMAETRREELGECHGTCPSAGVSVGAAALAGAES